MPRDGLNQEVCEVRHLTCNQWTALKAGIIAGARAERSWLLREMVVAAFNPLHAVWRGACELGDLVRAAARRLLVRQRKIAELRQLAAMSDLELKDIGITRTEIRAVAQSDVLRPRYGLRAHSTTQTESGDKHDQSLLDCPRLGS